MTSHVESIQQTQNKVSVRTQNVAVLAFGIILVFAVGFLPMDAVHSAAHDTRHALSFPCH